MVLETNTLDVILLDVTNILLILFVSVPVILVFDTEVSTPTGEYVYNVPDTLEPLNVPEF
jgi:hypothetical protein